MGNAREVWEGIERARRAGHTYRSIADAVNERNPELKKLTPEYLAVLCNRASERGYSPFVPALKAIMSDMGFVEHEDGKMYPPEGFLQAARGKSDTNGSNNLVSVDLVPLSHALAEATRRKERAVVTAIHELFDRLSGMVQEAEEINALWAIVCERLRKV